MFLMRYAFKYYFLHSLHFIPGEFVELMADVSGDVWRRKDSEKKHGFRECRIPSQNKV